MLLGAPGLTTSSKDATRGSWATVQLSLTTSRKDSTRGSWATVQLTENLATSTIRTSN